MLEYKTYRAKLVKEPSWGNDKPNFEIELSETKIHHDAYLLGSFPDDLGEGAEIEVSCALVRTEKGFTARCQWVRQVI